MTGTIRTFAAFAMMALFASGPLQGPGAAMADPAAGDDAAWREIQLRRKAIESLRKAAADAEEKAVTKLAKELKRKKIAPSQEGELQELLKELLTSEQLGQLKAETGAAGCKDLESAVAKWRVTTAKALFAVSKKASKAGFNGSAYRYADRSVVFDPENKQARAALGFVKTKRGWLPAWRAKIEASGKVFDKRAGWVAISDAAKLDEGLLPSKGSWGAAEDVLARRQRWANRWELQWGRWNIESDVSPTVTARAAEILDFVERTVTVHLGDRFDVAAAASVRILLFRSRESYEAEVDAEHPGNAAMRAAEGYFSDSDVAVHMVWRENSTFGNLRLLVHEATHALASETKSPGESALVVGKGDAVEEVLAVAIETMSALTSAATSPSEPGIERTLQSLPRGRGRLPLQDVLGFGLSAGDFSSADQAYDHAYALARFCGAEVGGTLVPWQIQEYLYYLRHHGPNPDLFAKMMGKSWPELEKDWSAFLDKLAAEGAQKQKK